LINGVCKCDWIGLVITRPTFDDTHQLLMIPIHSLPFWWYPFTHFPFDDTHSLPSLLMIPIHSLPFWWYPFTHFPFDDTHSLPSLLVIPIHFLHFWWHPFTYFPFDDTHSLISLFMIPIYYFPFEDTHSLPSLLMTPIHLLPFWWYPFTYFTFHDTHSLLPFWGYPFTSSLLMRPSYYFPFCDTHLLLHLWWYPFILMTPIGSWGSNSRKFFKSITQRHRVCKVEWWVLKKHSFLFITRQDRIFCEFCVPQGVFISCLRTLRTSFLMSWDTKGIFSTKGLLYKNLS